MSIESVTIEIDATAECGLVLQQAGKSAVRGIRICNRGGTTLVGMVLTVSSDIGVFRTLRIVVDSVQPGETVSVPIPEGEPAFDYRFLAGLADVREAEIHVSLSNAESGEIAHATARQKVYAPDQTLGCSRPIYYAAFVIPNCDATARIQSSVSSALEEATGSGAISGYLADKTGVYNQCKAIYRAVQNMGLTYAVCPSSFGQPGQKVRLPNDVVQFKTGCCLDMTLFFAAIMEKCGLRPVLVLFEDHAFVGCHLVDKSFSGPIVSDAEVLRKAIHEDTFVVFETTLAQGNASFAEAELSASASLTGGRTFDCAVDVAMARLSGVYALPVASVTSDEEVEGRDVFSVDENTRELAEDVDIEKLGGGEPKKPDEARVDGWASRLLDLSKANRLLNVRDTSKTVPLVCASPAAFEDAVAAGDRFSVRSFETHLDEEACREFVKLDRETAVARHREALDRSLSEHELWSALSRRETEKRLKDLFRTAKVDLEESGVNTVFLALGMLEWCERGHGSAHYRAPILLVPVAIERRTLTDGYRIRRLDEETIVNTTLLEMLRREYSLVIPGLDPLPADDSGLDVAKIFGIFRAAVREVSGLCVSEDCTLGQFSFGKFVMWKDLTSRIDAVRSNPIVSHLISRDGAFDDGIDVFPPEEVDRHLEYSKICCPLGADSSQLAAVIYSGMGKSFVLHGPPGTGKSQTITNIIAHNLWLGRRVLFVSEKKAALDVVYGRLAKLGLAPFCLQLHSNKSGKAEVYAQFSEALKVDTVPVAGDRMRVVVEMESLRKKLDGYVRALHRQTLSGFTPYDLFTKLIRGEIDGDGSLVSVSAREVTDSEYELACRTIASAADMREGIPAQAVASLGVVRRFAWSPTAEKRLADDCARLADEIKVASEALSAFDEKFEKDASLVERYFALQKARSKLESDLAQSYNVSELRKLHTKDLRYRLADIDNAFLPIRLFKMRAFLKELNVVAVSGRLDRGSIREMLRLASELQEADAAVSGIEPAAVKILNAGFNREMADPVVRTKAKMSAELALQHKLEELGKLVDIDVDSTDTDTAVSIAKAVAANAVGNLRHAFMYFESRRQIPPAASLVADRLDEDDHPSVDGSVLLFTRAFQAKLLNEIMESESEFGSFLGGNREDAIRRFCQLDEELARYARDNLVSRLSQCIPAVGRAPRRGDASELGLLMHECGKKMRQKPIRQILAETPTLTPTIKPCFLMSPLSVAQYLPVDGGQFDLVVFDEASQIPVWDAVGVIARGKQLIVVGDPKQLPPTSFFQKGPGEEEECEDLESVLEECLHAGMMTRFLGWHYRSRHESLIAFSNRQYYDNGLHVFPAAGSSSRTGVDFVYVPDGIYDAGGSRTNRREAEKVADIVVSRMLDPESAGQSVGVVAFSEAQRNLIEDMIDERCAEHPELEQRFAEREGEEFFVKNLENVQGDERDAIVFSIGYAPDSNGKFNMIFGPLSVQGGERRLNVAITRAREKIIVVSSIHGYQIDTDRTGARGPADLRAFLDYAEKGYRLALPRQEASDDHFAEEVASVLEKQGAIVSRDIGCGGVRIDIAVRDPDDESKYLFGVVCDGRGYASELTTRDRDRLRDEVLSSLGWTICRVWIVDWTYDRVRAERRLIDFYNTHKQGRIPENDSR